MLADASEAAVRALHEPTGERIQAVVRSITDEKIADGQLEQSGLSPEDIERVVDSLRCGLVSSYHARCAYPGQDYPATCPKEASCKSAL
jgi:membrane-associated HD superfamily phosphohydrolase